MIASARLRLTLVLCDGIADAYHGNVTDRARKCSRTSRSWPEEGRASDTLISRRSGRSLGDVFPTPWITKGLIRAKSAGPAGQITGEAGAAGRGTAPPAGTANSRGGRAVRPWLPRGGGPASPRIGDRQRPRDLEPRSGGHTSNDDGPDLR